MGHSYEKSKKDATKFILILAAITLLEVFVALTGKGHLFGGKFMFPGFALAGIMIIMSLYKAYLIVYEFMHMKYEVPALVKTVLLPTLLLVWAVIAFFAEGRDWQKRRDLITDKNNIEVDDPVIIRNSQTGMSEDTKVIKTQG
ncbi:MAG: cytochrome C oxidase subunit IV family protein [Saprospiraceae bacterium]|nr:cytochrome C oxidase subunit IV family protein [Bacteroidia bacterium]NNE13869.1 cytochrome C oxidase subunit IV family protein [Saprospiraceae bacterium]NNL91705.1 cytochrome C oxidase subunit IV family protein [Saprospiraceae bacterium]